MRTIGIGPGDAVLVIEHRKEQQIIHNALVAGISMKQELAGAHGEPVIAASFIADREMDVSKDGSVWFECPTLTVREIVHISHRDWIDRRASLGYQEIRSNMEGGMKAEVIEVLRAQHRALDMLIAHRIHHDHEVHKTFFRPSQEAPIWDAVVRGSTMLNRLEADQGDAARSKEHAMLNALSLGFTALQRSNRPIFECPTCHSVSYNPYDIANRYCGRCHEFTGERTIP